jgi:ABC-type molybdate transport system permease subunit
MRLELTRKTKATLVDIDIQSLKMGQTEVVPAVALAFKITLANSALGMLDKSLLTFLYAKGNSGAAAQQRRPRLTVSMLSRTSPPSRRQP